MQSTLFDAISPQYDLMNGILSAGLNTLWMRKLVHAILDTNPKRYLDLCCGTGAVVVQLSSSSKKPLPSIDCVDFSPAMIAIAQDRLSARNIPHRTHVADATALPFANDSYDTISIAYGIRNILNKEAAIREAARVLRPGGRLCILELTQPHTFIRPFHSLYLKTLVPLIGTIVTGQREAYRYLPRSIHSFSLSDLISTLRRCGFTPQMPQPLTFGVATLILAENHV